MERTLVLLKPCTVQRGLIGEIINRMADESLKDYIDTNGIPVLSYIEDDKNLSVFDIKGENIFNLPAESNVVNGVKKALNEIGVI